MGDYIVDVHEPWMGERYLTHDAKACAEADGVTLEAWLESFREATAEKGGQIAYEGDPKRRPQWLKDRMASQE